MKDKNAIIFEPGFFSDTLQSVCGLLSPIVIGFLVLFSTYIQELRIIFIFGAGCWLGISGNFMDFRNQKGNRSEGRYAALGTFILGALHFVLGIKPIETFLARALFLIGLIVVISLMLPMVTKRLKELKTKWKEE